MVMTYLMQQQVQANKIQMLNRRQTKALVEVFFYLPVLLQPSICNYDADFKRNKFKGGVRRSHSRLFQEKINEKNWYVRNRQR
jgi:hypothetical protein